MALDDPDLPAGVVVPELSADPPLRLNADRYRWLRDAYRALPRRSRVIVVLRLPLPGRRPLTLRSLGRLFGVGGERIRQLEHRAVWTLVAAWRPRRSPDDLAHPERIAVLAPIVAAAIDRHPLDGYSAEGS